MKSRFASVVLSLSIIGSLAPNALGLPEFKKAFLDRYAGDGVRDDFKKLARKSGCNVCHIPKKSKKEHNAYGDELAELISGNASERKKEAKKNGTDKELAAELLRELTEAFTAVEATKAESGETYGERLKSGKLPVE